MKSLIRNINNNNNISNNNNLGNVNIKVNKIKKLISNDNLNIQLSKNNNDFYNNDISLTNNSSKSFNENDNINNNTSNFNRIFNYKNNVNLTKKRMNPPPHEIKENQYIFNIAMNNLNKYKDNLVKENSQISNQINNKKFTNNIINYCLINPDNNSNNNNFYNIDNDDIFINENGKNFPLPEPTPIKISRSSNDINRIKSISLHLKQNIPRNNNKNYSKQNYYHNYFNRNDNIDFLNKNNNAIQKYYNDNNGSNKNDYQLKKNLNNYYNNTFANERNKLFLNQNQNLSHINCNKDKNNNEDEHKLIFVLNNLNLSFLIDAFKINYISFNDLFLLTREDLLEMKIPIGPRNKIIHFIQEYKKHMKSFEFNDISNFLIFYKNNNNLIVKEQKIENNIYSTTQTTNDFSNRIKMNNQKIGNFLYDEKKEDNFHQSNCVNMCYNNTKDIINPNNSICSLLNSSYNYVKTSLDKNNINKLKRNSSSLINLQTTSYINPNNNKNHKNNSVICKDKLFKLHHRKENQKSKKNDEISYKYNKVENINHHNKNTKKSRPINKKNLRNPLIKLIEDTQTNKTFSIINGQIMNMSNSNLTNNIQTQKIAKNYDNKNKKIVQKNQIDKKKKNKSANSNIKIKNNSNHYDKNKQNINLKIIENFNSLNNEVENFQNRYKRLKKASYERENKIKHLLMEDKSSSSKNLKLPNQQINNLSSYNINNNDMKVEKKNNKNLVFKNKCQNKNNIQLKNDNEFNNKKNTFIYELNIENVK